MTKGRVYVTLDSEGKPKFISCYDNSNKRNKLSSNNLIRHECQNGIRGGCFFILFDGYDEVVFLQQITYIVQGGWRNYVRTCCSAAYVDKVGTYDNIRKVARLYYEKESVVPYDKPVTEIAAKVHLTARTVDICFLTVQISFLFHHMRIPAS